MEPLYSETYIEARPSRQRRQKRVLLILLCIVLLLVDVFVLHSAIGLFFVIVADALIIYFLPTNHIAYEYVFVDGQIDFDCIYAGSKRKNLAKMDLETTDIVAPAGSHELDSYRNLKCEDYSSGYEEHKHYVLVYRGENGVSSKIKFTPDEKMLYNMKMKAHSKVKEY